ncbi:Hypothetical predicted protein [Pelobates cultripes]|uniref:Uncharacterized protein n=1 Tax=Pelobates cultripes TaxID=61616 RepID=A0AAD1S9N0_PELCU|nr:Hypothetical predicted protein [Pelobates cultripes]
MRERKILLGYITVLVVDLGAFLGIGDLPARTHHRVTLARLEEPPYTSKIETWWQFLLAALSPQMTFDILQLRENG